MWEKIEKEMNEKNLKDDFQNFDNFVFSTLEKNNYQISLENKIELGGIKGFILKIAQKIMRRVLNKTIEEQNAVNNILNFRIKKLEEEIQNLKNPRSTQ